MGDHQVPGAARWEDLPHFLTVEQASTVLQVGRTSAYKLTEQWERTGMGLPFVRLGGLKRVPREALREMASLCALAPQQSSTRAQRSGREPGPGGKGRTPTGVSGPPLRQPHAASRREI